jgi:hypothetical protein
MMPRLFTRPISLPALPAPVFETSAPQERRQGSDCIVLSPFLLGLGALPFLRQEPVTGVVASPPITRPSAAA